MYLLDTLKKEKVNAFAGFLSGIKHFLKRYGRCAIFMLSGWLLAAAYIIYDYLIYSELLFTHLLSPPYFYELFFHVLMIIGAPLISMFLGYQYYKKTDLVKELKEQTEKWKKTYDSMPDFIFILDNHHYVIDANTATMSRFGDNIIGKKFCYAALGQQCFPHETCPHNKCVTANITVKEEFSNGNSYELTCSPIIDSDSRTIGTVHVVKDITEKKNAEIEKKNLEAQLLQAQKMESLGRFAGGIAHDFNNMITGILGYSEMISQNPEAGEQIKKDAAQIKLVAEKAANLTKSILTFSRKKVENTSPVDINKMIHNVETFLERVMGKDVKVKTNLWYGSLIINADEGKLEQVIMNLATNARDAMPDGGIFTIESRPVDFDDDVKEQMLGLKKGRYVLLTVSDSGTGMDSTVLKRIFEPFYTTKELGRGTGLGLAICYSIIKQHSGHIEVRSEPWNGTTFNMYLPIMQ